MELKEQFDNLRAYGPEAASIAAVMEEVKHNYENGSLTKDEAIYLVNELKEAKIGLALANDEIAQRAAYEVAQFLMNFLSL